MSEEQKPKNATDFLMDFTRKAMDGDFGPECRIIARDGIYFLNQMMSRIIDAQQSQIKAWSADQSESRLRVIEAGVALMAAQVEELSARKDEIDAVVEQPESGSGIHAEGGPGSSGPTGDSQSG